MRLNVPKVLLIMLIITAEDKIISLKILEESI